MSIPTDTSQRTPAAYEQNGELDSEDDDPWSDPWMSTCSARGSNSKVAHAASSVYSAHSSSLQNESQPTQMEPTAHTVAHNRPVYYDACHYMDHISLADSPPPRQSGVASKHNSFAAKIRAALRLSHQESDDDSDLSEPTLPPPAHFAASQSTSPACQLDSGRTRRVAPRDHKSSFTTTPPHAQSAKSKFLLSHQKMRGLDQAVLLGMRAPYWTPASSTPEDTHHQFGRRPRIKHEKMLFDIDVDKNHSSYHAEPRFPQHDIDEGRATRKSKLIQACALMLIASTCFGLQHAFGIFMAAYASGHPGSRFSAISLIGSTQLALLLGLSSSVSMLIPRAEYRLLYAIGTALLVTSVCCTSWCTSIATLWIVQGLLTGLGMSITLGVGVAVISTWCKRSDLLLLLALSTAGGYAGGIVYTLVINELLVHQGHAITMRVLAGIVLLAMLPPTFMMRMCEQERGAAPGPIQVSTEEPKISTSSCLLLLIGTSIVLLGSPLLPVYATLLAPSMADLTPHNGSHLLAVMLAAGMFGSLLVACVTFKGIAKTCGAAAVTSIVSSVVVLAWLSIQRPSTFGTLALVSTFYGLTNSGLQVLCLAAPFILTLVSTVRQEHMTPHRGTSRESGLSALIYLSVTSMAILLGAPSCGALISGATERHSGYEYRIAQVYAGSMLIIGGALMLLSRAPKVATIADFWERRK
ncbi:putative MFS transporter superfamily [Septoria linicola]|nr:putative MFS transporter superfamily [Septoria linicola]